MILYSIHKGKTGTQYHFLQTTKVEKIENVAKIIKGFTKTNKGSTYYALIGEELQPFSMGTVEPNITKNQNTFYVGAKVYATNKQTLCEYLRQKAHEKNKQLQEQILLLKKTEKAAQGEYISWYEAKIKDVENLILDTQKQYKTIIQNIKNI